MEYVIPELNKVKLAPESEPAIEFYLALESSHKPVPAPGFSSELALDQFSYNSIPAPESSSIHEPAPESDLRLQCFTSPLPKGESRGRRNSLVPG